MPTHKTKVFGIGLSKTGTTSLARALEILGYRTKDYLGVTRYIAGDLSSIDIAQIDANDAFTDTPIPSFYKELDKRYPHSKFILTTRDMEGWLKSCKKQFTERIVARENEATAQVHKDLYGCHAFDPEKYASGYTRHLQEVLDYFKDRPEDLLVIDIPKGKQNWEMLCEFLNQPVPDMPFPVTNVSAIQWMNIQNIVLLAKEAGQKIDHIYEKDLRHQQRNSKSSTLHRVQKGLYRTFSKFSNPQQQSSARLEKATRISCKIIVEGLKKMNPSIPVISPDDKDTPYSERMNWGYVWLVDPLNGSDAFINHQGNFTVNIALIEGSRPVWGVVYNPLSDTVYYAKGASGSYKIIGDNEPQEVDQTEATGDEKNTVILSGKGEIPEDIMKYIKERKKDFKVMHADSATALCLLAESKATLHINIQSEMEWQTAAADAIARAAGKSVCDFITGEELTYNKENMVNSSFVAE